MRRNTKIIIAISIYVGIIIGVICYFCIYGSFSRSASPSADPKKTISGFVTAYNADDIVKMLDCITADKRTLIQEVLNAADDYSDMNVKAAIQMMPIASKFAKYANQDDLLPDIEVEIGDFEKKGTDCKVKITASAESVHVFSVGLLVNLKYDPKEQVWLIDSAQLADE